jgi:hypothetical protein
MSDSLLLVVRSEPFDRAMAGDYHRWYAQHVDEITKVPGVLNGRRFECIDGEPDFMAMYEIADFDVFSTPAYRQVKGFGPMSDHVRFTRNVYRAMPVEGPR